MTKGITSSLQSKILASVLAMALACVATIGFAGKAFAEDPNPGKTLTGVTDPWGVAVAPNGDIYVSNGNSVSVFEPGHTTANPAKAVTGLNHARELAFDADGLLYAASLWGNQVNVYDLDNSRSTPVRQLAVTSPFGVGVNSDGQVYVSSYLTPDVFVFDANQTTPNVGEQITLPEGFAGAIGIDPNDNVYIGQKHIAGDSTKVYVYDKGATTPTPGATLTGNALPNGIAFSPEGQVFVTQGSGPVLGFQPGQTTADPSLSLTTVDLASSEGIAISQDATTYVGIDVLASGSRVLVYDPPGPPTPPAFECTEGPQSYQVPTWTHQLNVTLSGAQGGGGAGGWGGKAQALVDVTPGETVQVNVGCQGADSSHGGTGGFNGGANAGSKNISTGSHLGGLNGGGGGTDLRIGDCANNLTCGLSDRLLIAGGGGGAEVRGSNVFKGGGGGYPTGTAGDADSAIGVGKPGQGATASAGGAGGAKAALSTGSAGSRGSLGVGGAGGNASTSRQTGPGAGGGGGLFGGGGGGSGNALTGKGVGGAGGGGSSGEGPKAGSLLHSVSYQDRANRGQGGVDITPVVETLSVTTTSLSDGKQTVPYSQQLQATGGVPAYTWTLSSGTLPVGLDLSPGGEIQGTPTANGTSNFTVEVTDSLNHTATKPLSIIIDDGIVITTTSVPAGSVGAAYSAQLQASGDGGAAAGGWSVSSGTLPTGLSLDADSGLISGTPTAAGSSTVVINVLATGGSDADGTFTFDISPALRVATSDPLPTGTATSPYSANLTAAGGLLPYNWAITAGQLPAGLSLDAGTGVISGTPTSTTTKTFTAQTTDYLGTTASKQLTISVQASACSVHVKARAASKSVPKSGNATLVSGATTSKGCRLRIVTSAAQSVSTRGDVRFATFTVNKRTGHVTVRTYGTPGIKVRVKITGVPTSKTHSKSGTWSRSWGV